MTRIFFLIMEHENEQHDTKLRVRRAAKRRLRSLAYAGFHGNGVLRDVE